MEKFDFLQEFHFFLIFHILKINFYCIIIVQLQLNFLIFLHNFFKFLFIQDLKLFKHLQILFIFLFLFSFLKHPKPSLAFSFNFSIKQNSDEILRIPEWIIIVFIIRALKTMNVHFVLNIQLTCHKRSVSVFYLVEYL